jgi:hypothetical protein
MKTFNYYNNKIRNNYNSYIKGKNDFSKYSKNNLTNLNDLSFDNVIKKKYDKKQINDNLSYFKKVIDRTFNSITNENLPLNIPLNNISDFNDYQINKTNQSLEKKRCNSSKNIKVKKNNNLPQYYINKNYNKVFGEEGNHTLDKTVKLVYQIDKMKKKIGNSENNDLMNRPKVHIKDSKIINDYNDISISIQRKFNRLLKPNKRNINYINIQNNIPYFDYNNKNNNNNPFDNFLSLKKRQNSNPNLTINKNNNHNKININILNDYYNEREIDDFKKSFYSNKLRNYITQKYINTKENK